MSKFDRKDVMKRLRRIGERYDLSPSILRDVMEGHAYGMSLREISKIYGPNWAKEIIKRKINQIVDTQIGELEEE